MKHTALGMPVAAKPLRHLMEKRDLGSSSLRTDVFIEPGAANGPLKIRRATHSYQATSTVMYLQDYGYFFTTQDVIQGEYKTRTTLVNAQ
ncbi:MULTISPECIES: hypothetical protein [Pseudomonas]|uniref:Uncharacterized protein n=1 Tax=Pseudomonas azadiae TaxID=2843612 RepID=A0ABS6P0M5_9PSED|nr:MULTISPECIES: hypothetical protein [Pseudomonas]MBV4454021.1 hypothetical protein [Pseudomonas azadiae]